METNVLNKRKLLFPSLTNTLLLEAYKKALELNLDHDFIKMLEDEIDNRNLKYP